MLCLSLATCEVMWMFIIFSVFSRHTQHTHITHVSRASHQYPQQEPHNQTRENTVHQSRPRDYYDNTTGPNTLRVRSIHASRVPSNSDGCPSHFESRATTEVTQREGQMAMRLTASVLLLCRLCARPQVRAPAPARARRRRWPPLTAEAGVVGVVLGYGSSVSTRDRMSLTREIL